MLHLGRAIGDAPEARYPTERLASMALDAAAASDRDARAALAAVRALDRATADAPSNLDLIDALAAVLLRLGRPEDAERRMNAVMAKAPDRARSYVLLAQALRAQSKFDAALATLHAGTEWAEPDLMLGIEKGMVLAAMRNFAGAAAAWNEVLARHPVHPIAFARLSALAIRTRDATAAESLIDMALTAPEAPAEVFRHAVQLTLGTEAEGLARASRVLRLCERWVARNPGDHTASLVMVRSLLLMGDRAGARTRLAQVERVAPRSPAAAELAALRLAIDEPAADLEIQSVLRAAHTAPVERLVEISARARRLATLHSAWTAWLAAALAERRRRRWAAARGALEIALELAPGAAIVQLEMAEALIHLDDAAGAVSRVRAALALDGPSAGALALLARALAGAGRTSEAIDAVTAAMAFDAQDVALSALLRQLKASKSATRGAAGGWFVRRLHAFTRWLQRLTPARAALPSKR
jgi:tetratricopeptide (TPR) repeat protein